MNLPETKDLLDRILRQQIKKVRLIIAIYLPEANIEAIAEILTGDNLRPGSVGRYCNVPIYGTEWMRRHDEWLIERFENVSYGYIQMDSVD